MAGGGSLLRAAGPALVRAWQQRGTLALALLPLSWLYAALVAMRRMGYRLGILSCLRLPCAVMVVGNVVAGGAGKTPTTMGIVAHLRSRGLSVGVVSRGYGRRSEQVQLVQPGDDPGEVGDEPLLMARSTGAPVCVGRSRHAAALALLAAYPQTQVIVCDDGLQHFALYRDLEVCVFDDRGVGNGWLLPAGPLRETWPRRHLASVGQAPERSVVLHTGNHSAFAGFTAQRKLASHAIAHDQQHVPLAGLQGPLLALAGIASPQAFFDALRGAGLTLAQTLALPDHFDFSQLDTAQLEGYQVLCTEKDAVKLWRCWPHALAVPLIQTPDPAFYVALDALLDPVLHAKLSSPHGHQTS